MKPINKYIVVKDIDEEVKTESGMLLSVTDKDFWENMNEVVASEIKHIYDHDGYHCEIAGFRKFVVSG